MKWLSGKLKWPLLANKWINEILFIILPIPLAIFLFSLVKGLPLYPYTSILGSIILLILVLTIIIDIDYKTILFIRAALVGALYLFWLQDSIFCFEGMFRDSRYVVMSVERFYHSFLPFSHAFKEIHFSLPPLYFFTVGRAGALFNIPVPLLTKYAGFVVVAYLPYFWGYVLKPIFSKNRWKAAFLFSLIIPFKQWTSFYDTLGHISQKSWHYLGMFAFLVWLLWIYKRRPSVLKAGLWAGLIFALNYYVFIFLIIVILVEWAKDALNKQSSVRERINSIFQNFKYYLSLGAVVLLINLVWLIPVAIDLMTHKWGTSFNEWFQSSTVADFSNVVTLFKPFDLLSIILIIGVVNLWYAYKEKESNYIDTLRFLFLSMVVFGLVIYTLTLFKISLALNNYSTIMIHILAFSAVLFLLKLKNHWLKPIAILLIINSFLLFNNHKNNMELAERGKLSTIIYREGIDFRKENDLYQKIVFPYTNELFTGENTYSFISHNATFADKAGSYEDRLKYVIRLHQMARRKLAVQFHEALTNTPFGKVSYITLKKRQKGGRLFIRLKINSNDLKAKKRYRRFSFPKTIFKQHLFKKVFEGRRYIVFEIL